MKEIEFWYICCNTDIDQYEYITMTEPCANFFETQLRFVAIDAGELLEFIGNISEYSLGDVFEIDGLVPLFEEVLK